MRFETPLLLLLLLPVVAVGALLATRRPAASGRDLAARGLRLLACVLLVVALAQPQISHGSHAPTVLVLDRSASIDAPAGGREAAWLRKAREEDPARAAGVVTFAGSSRFQRTTAPLPAGAARTALEPGQTDLAGALRLALGRVPAGGRLVVLSDGAATTRGGAEGGSGGSAGGGDGAAGSGDGATGGGGAAGGGDGATDGGGATGGGGDVAVGGGASGSEIAARARSRGVRVDGVQLADGRRDVAVARLDAPAVVHVGDPLPVLATIHATVAGDAAVALRRDGSDAGDQRLALRPGDTPLQLALTAPDTPGAYSYRLDAALAGDLIPQNDALDAAVTVSEEPRVLVVADDDSSLPATLADDGMAVTTIAPGDLPTSADGYDDVDTVVLDDVSATAVGAQRAEALVAAVRGGLGLLAFGGPGSFSLGRYAGSPLDAALPVASLRPGNRQQRDLALELVLDRSGSMADVAGGVPKISMAQAAARVGARFAAEHRDQFGIVSFDIAPRVLIPLSLLSRAQVPGVTRTIDGLQADGGTDIFLALQQAAQQIETSRLPQRHMILMSDGVSEDADYGPLLRRLAQEHVTVSAVALGDQADTRLLQRIAEETRGHYYQTSDAHQLPRIFARDARRTARPTRVRGRIRVTPGADSPIVRSLAGRALPALRENVVTTLRPGAQADLLGADRGERVDPVLAHWQYGSGRVVAWTPGVAPANSGTWAGERRLWQDAARWAERAPTTPALTPALLPGDPARVVVDPLAAADEPLELADLTGTLVAPDGRRTPLRFAQTAPSTYVAAAGTLAPGVYDATVVDEDGTLPSASAPLAVPYPAEYLPRPGGSSALGPLTAGTGGALLDAGDTSALVGGETPLWWALTLAALLAFLGGVTLRLLPRGRRGW